MIQIEWKAGFSVHVREIDNDHKVLIALFNDLANTMRDGKGQERIGEILRRLIDYTKGHFAREEELMMKSAYEHYESHKRIHNELTEKALQLYRNHKEKGFYISVEVLFFLKSWLEDHILEKDKALGRHLVYVREKEDMPGWLKESLIP